MSTDDPFAFVQEQPDRKQPKKPHWREKLFSKDKQNRGSTDQQIEAFLAPVRSKSVSYGVSSSSATSRGVPTPRLDVPNRWPAPQDVLNATSPVSNPSPTTDQYQSLPRPRQKSRARKGLKVTFADKGPEVIGEGGDESELPTIEISLCRNRRRSKSAGEVADDSKPPYLRLDTSFGESDNRGSFEKTHQRRNTGDELRPTDRKPLIQNAQDSDFLMTLNIGDGNRRVSFRASPESNSFAQRVRAKMQAEEGRALQHRYQDPQSPATEDPDARQSPAEVAPDSPDSMYETPSVSGSENSPPAYVLRSPPSPAARSPPKPCPAEPTLPTGLTPGGNARQLSPPKPSYMPADPALESSSRPTSRDNRETPRSSPQPPKMSLRSLANQVGDTAFADLKAYAAQYGSVIQISAEQAKPLMETSLVEWMRAAVWWFMRGKKRLELYARSRSSSSGRASSRTSPKQAVVDLAKALWINEHIVPQHPELARYGRMSIDSLLAVVSTTGDHHLAELLSLHHTIMNHVRSLAMSIKRNNILDVIATESDGSTNIDTSVWLRYPFFAPDVSAVLSGAASRSMLVDKPEKSPSLIHMMPLGDTSRYFSYGSMFVDVCVSSREDDSQQQFSIPCALSIIRDRADWYVFAAIASQSDLVNVMIQSDRKRGPTWDDVDWQVRSHSMRVKLPRGFELDIMFQEDDFKNLWNIVQYTRKTEASLQPEAGETMIFETSLKVFQYMDPGTPRAFPVEPIERCRVRLFERSVSVTEGTGTRNAHRGFRITVLTSPKVKTLSNVKHIVGHGTPIVFGLLRGEDGAPAMLIKAKEDGRTRTMLMTFQSVEERTTMHSLLLGMLPKEGEVKTSDIPIRAYSIEQPGDRSSGLPPKTHVQFPAGTVTVIDQAHGGYVEHGYGPTVLSENLRAFVATEWGSATDRINLGPGELKLGLDINNRTGLSLYRPAQQDLTVSVAENLVTPEMPDTLTEFLQLAMVKPMIRRFDFATVKDLHKFQAAVTGFQVLFDSVASSFSISRRRMVVPITKKWEASMARIQIVQQEKVVQLIAFLNDFNHGKCMNFVLKGTDTLESFGRSGKFGVRIVDAKFALPKTDEDPASNFVCLDMPEYAIEHDDISITFDSEEDRAKFQAAAPGSVREPSRMGSLRR